MPAITVEMIETLQRIERWFYANQPKKLGRFDMIFTTGCINRRRHADETHVELGGNGLLVLFNSTNWRENLRKIF
jgi:hypothetical protein